MSIKTFVVHPWSGTVFDAEDGVIVVNVPAAFADATDSEIVEYAKSHGLMINGAER